MISWEKDRTVENMLSMEVSRELSKEKAEAYASTSITAIHAEKSFCNKPPNIRYENRCHKCGRTHNIGKCPTMS